MDVRRAVRLTWCSQGTSLGMTCLNSPQLAKCAARPQSHTAASCMGSSGNGQHRQTNIAHANTSPMKQLCAVCSRHPVTSSTPSSHCIQVWWCCQSMNMFRSTPFCCTWWTVANVARRDWLWICKACTALHCISTCCLGCTPCQCPRSIRCSTCLTAFLLV